jgi:hypothetical protein
VGHASAQEVGFGSSFSYQALTKQRSIVIQVNVGSIENRSNDYETGELKLQLALCNRAYAPKTATKTKCTTIASKNLPSLDPYSYYSNFSFSSGGFRKVKSGKYRVVLFLADNPVTGIYDWINFRKPLTIR